MTYVRSGRDLSRGLKFEPDLMRFSGLAEQAQKFVKKRRYAKVSGIHSFHTGDSRKLDFD